jgi:hypothetical protein
MPSINIQKKFASAVEKGAQKQYIGKQEFLAGEMLYLTSNSKSLGVFECISSVPILIGDAEYGVISSDGVFLNVFEQYQLAQDNGFKGVIDLTAFYKKFYGLPFVGFLTKW